MTTRAELEGRLNTLLADAEAGNFKITVYLRPMPGTGLAMGNTTMVGSVNPTSDLRAVCQHVEAVWDVDMTKGRCVECDAELRPPGGLVITS